MSNPEKGTGVMKSVFRTIFNTAIEVVWNVKTLVATLARECKECTKEALNFKIGS